MIKNDDLRFKELLYYWRHQDLRQETKQWRNQLTPEEKILVAAWDKKYEEIYKCPIK